VSLEQRYSYIIERFTPHENNQTFG